MSHTYMLSEVAEACQLSLNMIYKAIEQGQLRAIEVDPARHGVKGVVTEEDLLAYKRWRVRFMGDFYPDFDPEAG